MLCILKRIVSLRELIEDKCIFVAEKNQNSFMITIIPLPENASEYDQVIL